MRICLVAASFLACMAAPVAAQDYSYSAQLRGETRIAGPVEASGVLWGCQGDLCTTSGPWEQPGLIACQALAQRVGEIVAYGRDSAMFDAATLVQCNVGVTPGGVAPAASVVLGGVLNRVLRPGLPTAPGAAIGTRTLTLTGTGAFAGAAPPPLLPPPPAFRAVLLRAGGLTVTGTGAFAGPPPPLPPPPAFSPIDRRTTTLTVTGTGAS